MSREVMMSSSRPNALLLLLMGMTYSEPHPLI